MNFLTKYLLGLVGFDQPATVIGPGVFHQTTQYQNPGGRGTGATRFGTDNKGWESTPRDKDWKPSPPAETQPKRVPKYSWQDLGNPDGPVPTPTQTPSAPTPKAPVKPAQPEGEKDSKPSTPTPQTKPDRQGPQPRGATP